ncbi:glycosyltransferase [Myxococcota bacterium]|nr:glycosyltransferase [Myxococcota bacterium]MBU1534206.1 glycosyltransferase [Myxococcota bacterium]
MSASDPATGTPYALFCDRWLPWYRRSLHEEIEAFKIFAPHIFPRVHHEDSPHWPTLHLLPKGAWTATSPSSLYSTLASINPAILKQLRDLEPAFLHAMGGHTGLYASKYASLVDRPLIVSLLGRDLTSWIRPDRYSPEARAWQAGKEELIAATTSFIVSSGEMFELALECRIPVEKLFRHRTGIQTRSYPFNMDYARLKPGVNDSLIVMKGRFLEEWGFRYGIKAFAHLCKSFPVRLAIIGDGDLREELQAQISDLHLQSRVTFIEPRSPREAAVLKQASLALIPSVVGSDLQREFSSRFTMEAAALGIPIVATSHGANADTVEDGVTGYLVPERDVDALSDRAAFLLEEPLTSREFAAAGRAKIEFQFDVKKTSRTLEGFFKSVLA